MCVGGATSQSQPVISGVPQGSLLGFNFYINNISLLQLTAGTMSIYADDVLLYCITRSQVDFVALQIDIDVDTLCVWTDENCLNFNAIKCKYVVISRKRQPTLPSLPIAIKDTPLGRAASYKYLGVWITSTLNWSLQIEETCRKARHQIGFLYRKFYLYTSNSTFLRL